MVSRGPDRQQKKAESKFKGNREERRLELSFSCAASSVPLTPTNERAVIKGTFAVVCTSERGGISGTPRHKATPRTDRRADSCDTRRGLFREVTRSQRNPPPCRLTPLIRRRVERTYYRSRRKLSFILPPFFFTRSKDED